MEIKLISKDEKAIEIEIEGENETLLNLLKQKLLRSEKVASATFLTGHPLLDHPRLFVEVKNGKPDAAIRQAAKELRESFDEFETQFVRAAGA